MKVLVLVDSFKGSMTSMEAGNAAKAGILRAHPQAEVIVKPLADGGEGTTEALIEGLGGELVTLPVTGPLQEQVNASYGILPDKKTAVMEMAQAAGITLVDDAHKQPERATTYGVGEMIKDAISKGCRKFIVGIGGSATNDGGIGMLRALGIRFLTESGEDAGDGTNALGLVHSIVLDNLLPELAECEFQVACDVENPLCGEKGATFVFGKQKGVPEERMKEIDTDMQHYARVAAQAVGQDRALVKGTGAAGGLGFAFLSFLNAKLVPGIELILDVIDFAKAMKDVDIVITGEGRLDFQTAMGKAPVGVAKGAKKHGCKKVLAFAGSVTADAVRCNEEGIDAFFPIVRGVCTLAEAMDNANAVKNMADTVEQVFRLL